MKRIDNGINCYTCKYFTWIHYTSKFFDFCEFFEEALPTNDRTDRLIESGEKLLICKNYELHTKFNNDNYSNLISQYQTFQGICQNLENRILYSYLLDNFCLSLFYKFQNE